MPLEPSSLRRKESMHSEQSVHQMVEEVLERQAKVVLERSSCSAQEALEAVSHTNAGRQLGGLRDGPHAQERARDWQEGLLWERAFERLEGMVRLDAYMERLEGKEARAEYYMLLEAAGLASLRG